MGRKMIPCAVDTTDYLIKNKQVTERVVLQSMTKIGSSPTTVS